MCSQPSEPRWDSQRLGLLKDMIIIAQRGYVLVPMVTCCTVNMQYHASVMIFTRMRRTPVVGQHVPSQANQSGGPQTPQAYRQLADVHASQLFDGYQRAMQMGDLNRVFLTRGTQPFQTVLEFSAAYTGNLSDMRGCGVAALYTGLPRYLLHNEAHLTPAALKAGNFARRVPSLIKVISSKALDTLLTSTCLQIASMRQLNQALSARRAELGSCQQDA